MDNQYKAKNFGIEIHNFRPTVTRNFSFENGDLISFTVNLEPDFNATIGDIHKQSVIAAIEHLKGLLEPQ